jgi:hypothetical protein
VHWNVHGLISSNIKSVLQQIGATAAARGAQHKNSENENVSGSYYEIGPSNHKFEGRKNKDTAGCRDLANRKADHVDVYGHVHVNVHEKMIANGVFLWLLHMLRGEYAWQDLNLRPTV